MNKIERITAVLEGCRPDRPPVSFWYHFGPDAVAGPAAVEAHVRHVETYDLDFLKVMDDIRYPRTATPSGVITEVEDLAKLSVLMGDEDTFGLQLEVIDELAGRYSGQLLLATTIFSPWGTLRQMTVPDTGTHLPPKVHSSSSPRDATMARFLDQAPEALAKALHVIAESLANFARYCVAAGADGIFLSVRDDWEGLPQDGSAYDRLVQPGDLEVLAGAESGRFNLLHICGRARRFDRFASYPVHVINWADRYAGPPIAEVAHSLGPAICAGVDNLGTMVTGSPGDCAAEVADALDQAAGRPMIVAAGCTFDPRAVPSENLHAIRRAVES